MINDRVSDYVSYLTVPEKSSSNDCVFTLGESFVKDEYLASVNRVISGKFANSDETELTTGTIRKILIKGKVIANTMDPFIKFNLFVLLFNNYYNAYSNNFFLKSTLAIKLIAKSLGIDKKEYEYLSDFYFTNAPYVDKNETVYIAGKNHSQIIRSKGINVHFLSNKPDEIIYLKYFKKYNVFLAKSFLSYWSDNSGRQLTTTREINIITGTNYKKSDYFFKSFAELHKTIGNFKPFQLVKVEATEYSPELILDPVKSSITISGVSRPVSASSYFEPVFEWLNNYRLFGNDKLHIAFNFSQYNTYTIRFLMKLTRVLNTLSDHGKSLSAEWFYEVDDEDSHEFGELLRKLSAYKDQFKLRAQE